MAKFLGIRFSELWWPWFKANAWSLLSGIPVLVINGVLSDRFLPTELGQRLRLYPSFLVLCIVVFFVATCLVEFLCSRRIARMSEVRVPSGPLAKAVVLANLVSYAVLGPIFYFIEYPRTDVREFTSNTDWARPPGLIVVAVGPNGILQAATADGLNRRVIVPHEVRDFVLSADLAHVLYRGSDDRYFLYQGTTNISLP